jgi:hypothetical protein
MKYIIFTISLFFAFSAQAQQAFLMKKQDAVTFTNDKSIQFSAGSEFVNLGNSADFVETDYTVSFWFKTSKTGFQNSLFRDSTFQVSHADYVRVIITLSTTTRDLRNTSVLNSDGNWHHVVFTVSSTNPPSLYIDGVFVYSDPLQRDQNIPSQLFDLYIGNNYALNRDFEGFIDEFSFFNIEFTASDVSRIYNNGTPTDLSSETGLVTWLRMGDGDTYPIITDQVGNNDGTMTNMAANDIVSDTP